MAFCEVKNLSFSYKQSKKKVLDDINFKINKGDFLLVLGKSGCGKTTLLRHLSPDYVPYGEKSGEVVFDGTANVKYIYQSPEAQIVTDKVFSELSLGLENMNLKKDIIDAKIAEILNYFGIQDLFERDIDTLSSGQKQIINIASTLILKPDMLVLDEPSSRLDPISAKTLFEMIKKANTELSTTIVICEHNTDNALEFADKLFCMDKGKVLAFGEKNEVISKLYDKKSDMVNAFPASLKISAALGDDYSFTVKKAKKIFEEKFKDKKDTADFILVKSSDTTLKTQRPILKGKNLCFRYQKDSDDILKDLNIDVYKGSIFALMGANGAGKTTLFKVLSGILKPYRGKVEFAAKNVTVSLLPQELNSLFLKDNIKDDFLTYLSFKGIKDIQAEEIITKVAQKMRIEHLFSMHPLDLSGGELSMVAIAKVLLSNPDILLLDEPTKGLDYAAKENLKEVLREFKNEGKAIVLISHDIDFCAEIADVCGLFFDKRIVSVTNNREFFSRNDFYTTRASLITRDVIKDVISTKEVISICQNR